jgi:hypothetical protein
LNIEDKLLDKAAKLTDRKTALVRLGLESLMAGKQQRRRGGTEKRLEVPPRRRAASR